MNTTETTVERSEAERKLENRIADLRTRLELIANSGCSAEDAALEARLGLVDDDRAQR